MFLLAVAPEGLRLILPRVILGNRGHDLNPTGLVPTLKTQLEDLLRCPSHATSNWPIMKWLFVDVMQIMMVDLTYVSAGRREACGHPASLLCSRQHKKGH